ncbi:MAG: adenylate/guanylate cyclase domain-containing protein [Acidimicrobiales bacterium]
MDDPEDTLENAAAELREWLIAHGAAVEQIEASEDEGHADGLAADLVLSRDATLSARDVAQRSALDVDAVLAIYRDLGISVPDTNAPLFTEDDVTLVSQLAQAATSGIVSGQEVLRVVAGAMERIAEAAVAVYVQGPEEELRRRGATPLEHAERNAKATELAMHIGVGLAQVFRHHMRQAIARQRVTQSGVSRRELARLAIGFVDLVGSTTLQAQLDPADLGALVTRFETRAFEVIAAGGGRLVKFIGDEIMVAAIDPIAGCHIVLDLVEAFTDDGTQPRGGLVFGEVLFRHGDYYGPVVNLAARLVDTAIPGEVLVDASVAEETKDEGLSFEPAGRRQVKGFDAPVAVWSLASA